MITINLLPEELKKKAKKDDQLSVSRMAMNIKMPEGSFKNIAITAALAVVILHASLFALKTTSAVSLSKFSKKSAALLPAKTEYDALKAEVDAGNLKSGSIDNLMANRFSWAKKLNDLSDSLAPGIWLGDLSYDEKSSDVPVKVRVSAARQAASNKKEIQKTEMRKSYLRYLSISGYASSMGEQGTALIGKFIKSMKDNPMFFSGFDEIKLESIKSDKVADQEVMSFNVTCLFKVAGS